MSFHCLIRTAGDCPDPGDVGAKAVSLFSLERAGFPVPRIACLTRRAYEIHLQGEPLASLLYEGRGARALRELILSRPLAAEVDEGLDAFLQSFFPDGPYRLAVRSSAFREDTGESTFAGLYRTVLAVEDRRALAAAVKEVWASLWDDAPAAWRTERGLPHLDFTMAVILQEMCDPRVSGVAFSRNPMPGRGENLLIQATPGLGDALLGGASEGLCLRMSRDTLALLDSLPDAAALLTETELRILGEAVLAIEDFFGTPQDVEWCFDSRGLRILQARPILTLDRRVFDFSPIEEMIPGNPTTFTAHFFTCFYTEGMKDLFTRIEYPRMKTEGILNTWFGRPYLSLEFVEACAGGLERELASGTHAAALERLRKSIEEELEDQWKRHRDCVSNLPDDPAESVARIVDAFCRGNLLISLTTLADRHVRALEAALPRDLAGSALSLLSGLEEAGSFPAEMKALAELARVGRARAALEASGSLDELAHRIGDNPMGRALERFLARYGNWGLGCEFELAVPRLSEGDALLDLLKVHVSCEASSPRPDPEENLRKIDDLFISHNLPWERKRFRNLLEETQRLLRLREREREHNMGILAVLRRRLLSLGEDLKREGFLDAVEDVFFLTPDEAAGPRDSSLTQKALERRHLHTQWSKSTLPLRFRCGRPDRQVAGKPVRLGPGVWARGVGVSPGKAAGPVRVLRRPDPSARLPSGCILVTPSADPCWAFYFGGIAGLVTGVGSVLSHCALLARESGIPAVMQVAGATDLLQDGEEVAIDGTSGIITKLSS
jgi:pyruvate,water dikinase